MGRDGWIFFQMQVLSDSPHLLSLPDPEVERFDLTDAMLSQLSALGFDTEAAKVALLHFQNVENAVGKYYRVFFSYQKVIGGLG